MKAWGIVVAVVLFVLGSFGPAGAGPSNAKTDASFDSSSLNLTSEQTEKIQTLRENRWKELKPLRNLLFSKLEELKSMISPKNQDHSKIKMMQSEILALQAKIHDRLTAYRMELKNILTPEQRSKLKAFGLERGYFRNSFKPALHDGNLSGDARRQ